MKFKKNLIKAPIIGFTVIFAVILTLLADCKNPVIHETAARIFTVTFDSDGGTDVMPQTVYGHGKAVFPGAPAKGL
ncbi:MAG: InlB B-repeat-containing protein, partial [Treponema sp.]|nr:InlB B-repeat-containing protein [Treponema sp.]